MIPLLTLEPFYYRNLAIKARLPGIDGYNTLARAIRKLLYFKKSLLYIKNIILSNQPYYNPYY